jgi:NnrS protein
MLLYAVQGLVLFTSGGTSWVLGLAPLHALGIGYFAGMVLAMASRVTLGHSGRPLVMDEFTWRIFLGFQFAALFRVLPDALTTALPAGRPSDGSRLVPPRRISMARLLRSLGNSFCPNLLAPPHRRQVRVTRRD